MAKKKKGGKRKGARRKGLPAPPTWLVLGLLALAVGALGGYLALEYRSNASLLAVEEILGPLSEKGATIKVATRAEARSLTDRVTRVARKFPEDITFKITRETQADLSCSLTVKGRAYPVRISFANFVEYPDDYGVGGRQFPATGPMLAVVIDDMGRELARDKRFLELAVPITPAILPYLKHSGDTSSLASSMGVSYLLHMPMEPIRYPHHDPGPNALLTKLDESEVRKRIGLALDEVRGAEGINNHMGSRFTADGEAMGWVADELKRRKLYFLDSVTTGTTAGAAEARKAGIGWARRDVFLDNERSFEAVTAQLAKGIAKAKQNGSAIVIGHPYDVTYQVLADSERMFREAGVRPVPLRKLLNVP